MNSSICPLQQLTSTSLAFQLSEREAVFCCQKCNNLQELCDVQEDLQGKKKNKQEKKNQTVKTVITKPVFFLMMHDDHACKQLRS